jgi:hypothetical protein
MSVAPTAAVWLLLVCVVVVGFHHRKGLLKLTTTVAYGTFY